MKEDLRSMDLKALSGYMAALGQPRFRAEQILGWIAKGAREIDEMRNLPKQLRERLQETAYLEELRVLTVQRAADGTRKYLLGLPDGNAIECVFMKYKYGNSACVSSQAGCRMGCAFCASTLRGLARSLTAGEMLEQILCMERDTGEPVSHVVVMGSGEPFDNYENLCRFLTLLHEPKGRNMSLRNITVSTCGLIPRMEQFREDFPQVNLAVSLHAPNQKLRREIMPVAKSYGFDVLLDACRAHARETGRRVTFEYALIAGFNDQPEHARELAQKLSGMLCHVNLIPLNRVRESRLSGTTREEALAFQKILEERGIPATIRRELGAEIDAACGQLRLGAQ